MLGHVSIFRGQYDMLFWIPAFIWIFDRVLRFLRISIFRPLSWTSAASASYNDDADIITLTVPVEKSSLCKPKPGTFYYIMVPGDRSCWESHPFTVASVPANNSDIERPREQTALLHSPNSSALELQETSKEELPKDSMTRGKKWDDRIVPQSLSLRQLLLAEVALLWSPAGQKACLTMRGLESSMLYVAQGVG
ncbi:hypothetical protein K4F52_007948 [Lecanicillium sp. MT-2017a]|nr:hypothetical protein K4F52_007948 [Lecanicillium sp. MT-2017a]